MTVLWLKKYWKWLLATVAIGAAFLLGFLSKKPKIVSPSRVVEDKKAEIEEKAEEEKAEAKEELDAHISEIATKREGDLAKITEEQEDQYLYLRDDPEKLSVWLRGVGSKTRQ